MADNSAKAVNMARNLAIAHLIIGFLLFCVGIVDRITGFGWTGFLYAGIWVGAWMVITGGLGIPATRKEQSKSRNIFAGVFMAFSIISAVLGGLIIIGSSITIEILRFYEYKAGFGIAAGILILGIVEFIIGIWAAICLCRMKPCCNNATTQQGQVVYTANGAFVLTPGSSGVPVAIPVQGSSGLFAAQTGAQGHQLQMVMVPITFAEMCQQQQAQAAPGEDMTTGYQPLHVDLPPPYEEQPYMTNV